MLVFLSAIVPIQENPVCWFSNQSVLSFLRFEFWGCNRTTYDIRKTSFALQNGSRLHGMSVRKLSRIGLYSHICLISTPEIPLTVPKLTLHSNSLCMQADQRQDYFLIFIQSSGIELLSNSLPTNSFQPASISEMNLLLGLERLFLRDTSNRDLTHSKSSCTFKVISHIQCHLTHSQFTLPRNLNSHSSPIHTQPISEPQLPTKPNFYQLQPAQTPSTSTSHLANKTAQVRIGYNAMQFYISHLPSLYSSSHLYLKPPMQQEKKNTPPYVATAQIARPTDKKRQAHISNRNFVYTTLNSTTRSTQTRSTLVLSSLFSLPPNHTNPGLFPSQSPIHLQAQMKPTTKRIPKKPCHPDPRPIIVVKRVQIPSVKQQRRPTATEQEKEDKRSAMQEWTRRHQDSHTDNTLISAAASSSDGWWAG